MRPTADRVREALFSILADRIPGRRVLDLFAGTGALGLEALSRGAASVVCVERDPAVVRILRRNLRALGVERRVEVVPRDVFAWLADRPDAGSADVVLADPPYGARVGAELLAALASSGALAAHATVVVEGEAADPVPAAPPGITHVRRATYARVALDFFGFPACPESG